MSIDSNRYNMKDNFIFNNNNTVYSRLGHRLYMLWL